MMNERTFYWNSPKDLAEKVIKLNRLERRKFFQSLEMHDVPMGSLMGFTKIQIDDDGRVSFYCKPEEYHYNPVGSVHGGFAATLLDSCNGVTAQCNLDKGFISLTLDLKINYLRPMTADTGEVVATGNITKSGRKVIFVSGELKDINNKLLATATSTEIIIKV